MQLKKLSTSLPSGVGVILQRYLMSIFGTISEVATGSLRFGLHVFFCLATNLVEPIVVIDFLYRIKIMAPVVPKPAADPELLPSEKNSINAILLGPPGSGKGTQVSACGTVPDLVSDNMLNELLNIICV